MLAWGGGSQGCPPRGAALLYVRCCGEPGRKVSPPRAWRWQRVGAGRWQRSPLPITRRVLGSAPGDGIVLPRAAINHSGAEPALRAPNPAGGRRRRSPGGGTRPLRAPRPPSWPCLISCCSSGLTRRRRGAAVGSPAVLGGFPGGLRRGGRGRRGGGVKATPSPSPCRPTGMQTRYPLNTRFLAIHHGIQTLLRPTLYVINYILMINYALVTQTAASRCC